MAQDPRNTMWAVCNSSHMERIGYNIDSSILYIEFKNGVRYAYSGVPSNVAVALLKADSHGTFFHQNIKDQYKKRKTSL